MEDSGTLAAQFERLPDAVLVTDDSSRYVYANPVACTLLQRGLDQILGNSVASLVSPSFPTSLEWERFRNEGAQEGEVPILLPGGGEIVCEFRAVANYVPGHHISILRDVSQRKRLESLLRRNEERYSVAFLASPAATNLRLLSTGAFVEINTAFTEATGFWRSDVVGRTAEHIGLWVDPRVLGEMLQELRDGSVVVRRRAELRRKDGSVREFSAAFKRADIDGQAHAVAVYTDMTGL